MATGSRVPSASDWSDKMIARATAAGNEWVKGTLSPRRDPTQAAIAANQKRIANFNKSVADKTYEGALLKVDPSVTAATIQAIGAGGYANGINARKEKIARSISRLQPLVAAHVDRMDKLPMNNDADAKAKMSANFDGMKAIGVAYKTGR